jgi:hypothetical protein
MTRPIKLWRVPLAVYHSKKGTAMLKKFRATSCPLCGHELGALIGEEWVAMPLDEYREHAEPELSKARTRTDTCVACGTPEALRTGQALVAA